MFRHLIAPLLASSAHFQQSYITIPNTWFRNSPVETYIIYPNWSHSYASSSPPPTPLSCPSHVLISLFSNVRHKTLQPFVLSSKRFRNRTIWWVEDTSKTTVTGRFELWASFRPLHYQPPPLISHVVEPAVWTWDEIRLSTHLICVAGTFLSGKSNLDIGDPTRTVNTVDSFHGICFLFLIFNNFFLTWKSGTLSCTGRLYPFRHQRDPSTIIFCKCTSRHLFFFGCHFDFPHFSPPLLTVCVIWPFAGMKRALGIIIVKPPQTIYEFEGQSGCVHARVRVDWSRLRTLTAWLIESSYSGSNIGSRGTDQMQA